MRLVSCLFLGWSAALAAGAAALAHDPFSRADGIDEIGVSRLAEEAGDASLAAHLADPRARQAALLAARASPHARAPEALLAPLALLACGRDPALAPEAAFALLRIAETLRGSELAAREVLKSELVAARRALACGEQKPAPRPDIALALARAGAALDPLLR